MMLMWMFVCDDDDDTLGAVWEQDHRQSREGKDLRRTRWPPEKRLATFFFCPALTLIVFNIITETKMATNHHCCLFQPSSRSTEGIEQQWEGGRMHLQEIRKSWKEEQKETNIHASVSDLTFYFFNRTKISDWSPCQMCIVCCKRNFWQIFLQGQEHDTCSRATHWNPSCQGSFLVKVVTWVANHLGFWY